MEILGGGGRLPLGDFAGETRVQQTVGMDAVQFILHMLLSEYPDLFIHPPDSGGSAC